MIEEDGWWRVMQDPSGSLSLSWMCCGVLAYRGAEHTDDAESCSKDTTSLNQGPTMAASQGLSLDDCHYLLDHGEALSNG